MTSNCVCITGASSGIGLELAQLFAADKRSLILVARRRERLEKLAASLSRDFGVEVHSCPLDLSQQDSADDLCRQLSEQDLQVGTLINNAGFGLVGSFAELDLPSQLDMLSLNIRALTELTHRLLPSMISRRSGGILNVASVAAYQPGPYMAVYYATKSYVLSFSHALRQELRGSGVHVTCLAPGPTQSEFGQVSGLSKFRFFTTGALSAEAVAKAGYRGFKQKKAVVIPGIRNRVMVSLVKHLPQTLTSSIVAKIQQPE